METILHSLANKSLNIIKHLNDNIIQLHGMMEENKKGKEEKEIDGTKVTEEEESLQEGSPSRKNRVEKRKRDEKTSNDDSHSKTDKMEAKEEMELKKKELAKDLIL